MLTIRKSSDRGFFDHGWLKTFHTFAFGHYFDPKFKRFSTLRVINEDIVAPGMGFGQHPHDNMEIVTLVLSGELAHKDTLGNVETIKPGEVQRMSAGSGLEHSEFNASKKDPVHLMQIWLFPAKRDIEPRYQQKAFDAAGRENRWQVVISPTGENDSLTINQDAIISRARLESDHTLETTFKPGRAGWLQVAKGSIAIGDLKLNQGDGLAIQDEKALTIKASELSELILFDLSAADL